MIRLLRCQQHDRQVIKVCTDMVVSMIPSVVSFQVSETFKVVRTADLSKLNIKLFLDLAGKALLRNWTFSACNPLGWNRPASSAVRGIYFDILISDSGVCVQGSIQLVAIKINTLLNPQPYRIINHFSTGRVQRERWKKVVSTLARFREFPKLLHNIAFISNRFDIIPVAGLGEQSVHPHLDLDIKTNINLNFLRWLGLPMTKCVVSLDWDW